MPLRPIGYWKEHLWDDLPFAQEMQTEYASDIRRRLLRYLGRGATFLVGCGYSSCRFGCRGHNGSTDLTDGVWLWPQGLAHYVRRHSVALPPEFVRDALRAAPAPKRSELQTSSGEPHDFSLWVSWGRQFRLPRVQQILGKARSAAPALGEEMLEAERTRWEADLGTDERSCRTEHCAHRALRDKPLCGRCLGERHLRHKLGLHQAEDEQLRRVLHHLWPTQTSSPPPHGC